MMPFKNKEYEKEYRRRYYATHRDECNRRMRNWYWRNLDHARMKAKEQQRRWRVAHPNHARDRSKEYARYANDAEHRARVNEQNRINGRKRYTTEWRRERYAKEKRDVRQVELRRAATKRWCKAHPERVRLYANKRRRAEGICSVESLQARFAFYGDKCAYCGNQAAKLEIDHIIPIAKGGTNWASNLAPACPTCNRRKGASVWIPVIPKQGQGEISLCR